MHRRRFLRGRRGRARRRALRRYARHARLPCGDGLFGRLRRRIRPHRQARPVCPRGDARLRRERLDRPLPAARRRLFSGLRDPRRARTAARASLCGADRRPARQRDGGARRFPAHRRFRRAARGRVPYAGGRFLAVLYRPAAGSARAGTGEQRRADHAAGKRALRRADERGAARIRRGDRGDAVGLPARPTARRRDWPPRATGRRARSGCSRGRWAATSPSPAFRRRPRRATAA